LLTSDLININLVKIISNQFLYFIGIFLVILFLTKISLSSLKRTNLVNLIHFGLLLIILPAIVVSFSKGHSLEINNRGVGYGYIMVYFQFYGLAILFVGIYLIFLNFINKNIVKYLFNIIFSLILCFVIFLNFNINKIITDKVKKNTTEPRLLMTKLIEENIFDEINANDLLIRNYKYPHDSLFFYSLKANKKIYACTFYSKVEFPTCLKNYKFPGVFTYDKNYKNNYKNIEILPNKIYGLSYSFRESNRYLIIPELDVEWLDKNANLVLLKFKNYLQYNFEQKKFIEKNLPFYVNFSKMLDDEQMDDIFEITNFKIDEKLHIFYNNFLNTEGNKSHYFKIATKNPEIVIYNRSKEFISKNIYFELDYLKSENDYINILKNNIYEKIDLKNKKKIKTNIFLKPGINKISFFFNLKKLNEDPRNLYFFLINFKLLN